MGVGELKRKPLNIRSAPGDPRNSLSGRDELHFREIFLEASVEDNRRDQGMSVEGVVTGRVRGDEGES